MEGLRIWGLWLMVERIESLRIQGSKHSEVLRFSGFSVWQVQGQGLRFEGWGLRDGEGGLRVEGFVVRVEGASC